MDKNAFFHEATLRICGNLEIEKAMHATVQFLTQVMPVDWLVLEYFEESLDAVRTIAMATPVEGKKVDLLTPISKDAKQQAFEENPIEAGQVFLIEDPESDLLTREMLHFHNMSATSILVLLLEAGVPMTCSVTLASEGAQRFTQRHADLLALLAEPFAIAMSNTLKHREMCKLQKMLADDNRYLHGELRRLAGGDIVGANFGLKNVMHKVRQVAALDSPVLLLGETGTGKDVIANAIHYSSMRSNAPFVSVNCGAIADTLIDSELFGHEKGAFTGALAQKRGRFERANTGTIFLDEIGELPLQAQVRLLEVLQKKKIERVGGVKTIPLDIRIIAATNRDLEEMVKDNLFREDLWFRLNVFPIWIPPLRERSLDIPALVQHFITLKAQELKLPSAPDLAPGAIDLLLGYHWPGNVRELHNVIERALILNPCGPLTFEHFNLSRPSPIEPVQDGEAETDHLDTIVCRHIRRALAQTQGKVSGNNGAAALLGINPSTLRNRMKRLGIHNEWKRGHESDS